MWKKRKREVLKAMMITHLEHIGEEVSVELKSSSGDVWHVVGYMDLEQVKAIWNWDANLRNLVHNGNIINMYKKITLRKK